MALTARVQPAAAFAVRFRRGTTHAFFVLARERHAELLREQIAALRSSTWVGLRPMDVVDGRTGAARVSGQLEPLRARAALDGLRGQAREWEVSISTR